jgi:hypothetical protein
MPENNVRLALLDEKVRVEDADDEHVDISHAAGSGHASGSSSSPEPPDDGMDSWGHTTFLISPGHGDWAKLAQARRYDTFASMASDAGLFSTARPGATLYVRVAQMGRVPKAHLRRSSASLPAGAKLVIGLGGDDAL